MAGQNKKQIKIVTQLVTGHANLQRHRYIMGMEDNPDCRGCGMSETAIHLLTECPEHVGARIAMLGKPILSAEDIRKIQINRILKFAGSTGRWARAEER